jgi:hypothetical protein
MIGRIGAVLVVCAMLAAMNGCGGHRRPVLLSAVAAPAIPATVQEIANPLRGQYEDLLEPLFPQGNPAQERYPAWPGSYDGSVRVTWRQLQPTDPQTLASGAPDEQRYDFGVIDDALARFSGRGMRLTLRVMSYSSCCAAYYSDNTNTGVPDWVAAMPGATTGYASPTDSSSPGVTQVVPNWNDPGYLDGFEHLLAALGRRYDADERLSIFEFSGYGDFSENHNAYATTVLGAPGPGPGESETALGYFSQYRDQNITKASIARLIAAHVDAFPRTQLVVTPQNPEIVRQLLADDVTERLAAPVGFRSDCLGTYSPLQDWAGSSQSRYVMTNDPAVTEFRQRLKSVPVITEWCSFRTDPKTYYVKALRDVVRYHVSMTSSMNFPECDSTTPMDPELYELWLRANVFAGYRYSVRAQERSPQERGGAATIDVAWTNYGSAATTENWVPAYHVVDFTGRAVRTIPSAVALKTLVDDSGSEAGEAPLPASTTETVRVDVAGLAPGHYTLRASVAWQQHKPDATHMVDYPPMRLARDGRDDSGRYPIAEFDVARPTAKNY